MSLKKSLKIGQASLEYFILFLIVTLGIIATNFLWFNWGAGQANAQGQVRDIAQAYFENMSQQILGN